MLSKQVDLRNPNEVEKYILGLERSSKYKKNLLFAYKMFCKANEISWKPPKIRAESKPIQIPTEENIDRIIARASLKYFIIFSLAKHGLRPSEISKITLRDLDLDRGILHVKTSKHGAERTIKLKQNLVQNLKSYVKRKRITSLDQRIFPTPHTIRMSWRAYRKRAYENFRDPNLLKIRLYDLRHWFATTEYLKTRDIFHVKYLMGHKHIQSTMVYMHIAKGLENYPDEWVCKTARTIEEASRLIESGFQYVTTFDGTMLFKKRK
ncbi:tyrosine-type recombinase/integrase [Candidatus Bathyarchaeota archaeon]|nr:tyrosine-type recombinase/integrase [Candidatus Bathyarchaeota archaeon]